MVDIAKLAIEVDSSEATAAAKDLDALSASSGRTESAVKSTGKAANDTSGNLAVFGRRAGQAGIQVQQLVGQVQGGVSPMVALSQQSADLGFVLGFPLLGAVTGITAALAGPLVSSLFDATEQTDDLSEAVQSLRDELNQVTAQQISGAIIKDTEAIEQAIDNVTSSNRDLRSSAIETLEELTGLSTGLFGVSSGELVQEARNRLRENAALLKDQANVILETERDLAQKQFEARTGLRGFQTAVPINDVLGYNVDDYFRELEAQSEREIAIERNKQEQLTKESKQATQNRQQIELATVGTAASIAGQLTQIAAAGGEESFTAYKRLAQTQAAISASLAALNVLADPLIPTALKPFAIGTTAALAAVQIAQIEGQQYTARELGGQVKAGQSFLVGESGPEVLTMGSDGHITSNSNMGGNGETFVFQISTGVSQTVRAELMSMMPMITRTARTAVGVR